MSEYTDYTHAIVRQPPDCYNQCQTRGDPVDLDETRKQHARYVESLQGLGLQVIVLPPDNEHPDCIFVEDTAVVCNGKAFITRPGHPSRVAEVNKIREAIKKELDLPIVEIEDPEASIDGGDVLFTGRELFVGISTRTNEAGAREVAKAFPEFPVTPVKMSNKNGLHLKESLVMGGPDLMVTSTFEEDGQLAQNVLREAKFKYTLIETPDRKGNNCLYIRGSAICTASYPESLKILEEKLDCPKVSIPFSELHKGAGCLTCCSLLIKKQ